MGNRITTLRAEREELVRVAREFEMVLDRGGLSSEEIQSSIEELRPIRLRIHELDQLIDAAVGKSDRK